MPIATVLVATHDHGPMLLRSVGEGERAAASWRDALESAQQSLAEARAYAESLEAERDARR